MNESTGTDYQIEIKKEPLDPEHEQVSSSCIEYQDILEPLELKYEAEDEQVEEHARACAVNQPKRQHIKAYTRDNFEDELEEFFRIYKNFGSKYKEELIVRKCYGHYGLTGPKVKVLDLLTSSIRILSDTDHQPSENLVKVLIIPTGYPKTSFNPAHVTSFRQHVKHINPDLPKIDLKRGLISINDCNFVNIAKLFDNIKDVKAVIDDDDQLWTIFEFDPQKKPFVPENSASIDQTASKTIKISLKDFKNLTEVQPDVKIKEEPLDNLDPAICDVKIKEEVNDDQPLISNLPLYLTDDQSGTSHQDTYIIRELDVKQELTEDEFSYFTSNLQQNDNDEDEFQYNTVNSFKSDLATRRSVSHTVVSGKSDKSKAEAALLAMQELMKIEQDKRQERERSAAGLNQVDKPKTMNVSLNVNGIRVVTKVSLPNVSGTAKKPVKSIEEECKFQCPICFIKFKTDGQLIGHKRIHDTAKAKLNTADMTKNVYKEVKMRIEQIGSRRSIHVLLPNYDYAFIVTNSTANKLYMKCFRQACEVKAYSTNDGKFFVKVGDEHCHGSDREVILSKIDEKKRSDLEKTEVINKSVQEAIAQKQKQKNLMEEKKNALIERIKRSQEAASSNGDGKRSSREVKKRKFE
ncbi:uncharacterized protein [Chironomus tepperi]|uniref:uncharacterized protein n=1 Tax=Chironomus tepperi TaxID=113505 RepID=UPI00391F92A7